MNGVSLKISVKDAQAQARLAGLKTRIGDQRAIGRIMGECMRDSIEQTFAAEGSPAGSWRRVHASTLGVQYGRRSTKTKFAAKRAKKQFTLRGLNTAGFLRFAAKKLILQDTGRLKNSIAYRPASSPQGATQLIIGSNLIYARIHQLGGIIRPRTAKALRFPISTPQGIQWITKKSVTIPARPYLVFRPDDPAKISEAVTNFLVTP
jgi:phage gpG-like protein